MKPLLIYIELTKELSFNFVNPDLVALKEKFTSYEFLDIDNHSSADTTHYISKSIEEHDNILLIINQKEEDTKQPQLLKLLQNIIKKQTTAISIGLPSALERLLKARTDFTQTSLKTLLSEHYPKN